MQTYEDDFYLGRHVLEHRLVAREALLECLYQLAQDRRTGSRMGFARPLGVMLVERGLLTEEDLNRILMARSAATGGAPVRTDAEVGKLLVAMGLLREGDVQECVRMQEAERRAGRKPPRLGELVVRQGIVTQQQVVRALAYQKQELFACASCGVRVSAAPPPRGTKYRCRKCGGEVEPVEAEAQPGALAMREAEEREEVQQDIDRAVAAYLEQKGMVRRDLILDGQRLQSEFESYGLVVPLVEVLRRAGALTLQQRADLAGIDFARLVKDPDWKKQAIPGYRLLKRMASSGSATLYSADAVFGGSRVAVKVLHPERAGEPRSVARLQREADLLRRLACPLIMRGIEYGADRGYYYLVMEYFEGRSLGQAISEGGPFPLRTALSATRQVVEALGYLHSTGYLHRDLKADNILIDGAGRVKLCDLSFASPIPGIQVEGTTALIPPEAWTGLAGSQLRAELYAVGVLLYALLTGHEPFFGTGGEETACEQIEMALPVPNLMAVFAPPAVVQFLKRTMHPDPGRRFRDTAEVVAALGHLAGE